jgi:hypothetical protein
MMSRRKIEVIAAVVILILLLILLFIILKKPKSEVDTTPEPEQVVETMPEVNPADIPAPGVVSASTVARIFIERFGSYSSETDFANVDDVMKLATPSYQDELEILVEGYRRQFDENSAYAGISTQVITIKTVSESDTEATFLITTQREESLGNPGNTTLRYQDAEVTVVKSGDDWLINALTWK